MTNSKQSILKITAVHEAAHFILAVGFGLATGDVTIVPNRKRANRGSVMVWSPLLGWERGHGSRRELVDHYVETMYAGRLAEEHFFNIPVTGYTSDETAASQVLREWPPRGASSTWDDDFFDKYEAMLKSRARRNVRKYEREIAEFAATLLKRRMLGGDEAHRIATRLLARRVV